MSETIEGRWSEIFQPQYARVTLIVCLGVVLLAFNSFVATVSLPTAAQDVGGVALISWATTLFLVFAIVGGSGAAMLKQRLGARTGLLLSAGIFLLGTLIAAAAGNMEIVLVGRALQGLGEGIVGAMCFTLIPDFFPSRLVPKVFGLLAMMWAIAAFGGPGVTGFLTEMWSWRTAFLFSVPLVLIFGAMVAYVVPPTLKGEKGKGRFPGIRLFAIALGIMMVALASLTAPLPASALLAGSILVLAFAVWLDGRSGDRLMPPDAFRPISVVGTGLWMNLLINIAGAGSAVYLVLVVQRMWGYGPLAAGLLASVLAVAWSISAIAVANVKRKDTRKTLMRLGPAMITGGLLLVLAGLEVDQVVVVIIGQWVIGSGFGICNSYMNLSMMEAASDAERDRTSALAPTVQSAGSAIGAALAGVAANMAGLAEATSLAAIKPAIVPLYLVGAGAALLGLVAAWRMASLIRPQDQNSRFAAG